MTTHLNRIEYCHRYGVVMVKIIFDTIELLRESLRSKNSSNSGIEIAKAEISRMYSSIFLMDNMARVLICVQRLGTYGAYLNPGSDCAM